MALLGSGGQKKPVQWAIVGVVLFVLGAFAIFVADRVFNINILSFNLYVFVLALGLVFFVFLRLTKSLQTGLPMSFESWFTVFLVLAGIVALYYFFPGISPQFNSMIQSAIGSGP